jgi:hypothetical protein
MAYHPYFYIEFNGDCDRPYFRLLDYEEDVDEFSEEQQQHIFTAYELDIDVGSVTGYRRVSALIESAWSFEMPLDEENVYKEAIEEYWIEQIVDKLGGFYRRLPLLVMYSGVM